MKTKPTGIRFDIDDFEFISKREGLKTPQSMVSFLMKEYVKIYKVDRPSVFESQQPKVFDAPKINNVTYDESKQWQAPTHQRKKSVEEYILERTEIINHEEYIEWLAKLNSDPFLTEKQKQLCKTGTL